MCAMPQPPEKYPDPVHWNFTPYQIGRALRIIRKQRGLTQAEVADLVGLSRSQVSRIEAATVDVRLSSVTKLLRALGSTLTVVPHTEDEYGVWH